MSDSSYRLLLNSINRYSCNQMSCLIINTDVTVKEPHFSGHRERDASETSPDGTRVCSPLLPVQGESVQAKLAGKKEKQLKSDRIF